MNESEHFGPSAENSVRPALLGVGRNLLLDAVTPTEIADECQLNRDFAEEEAQLAGRIEAWAF